MRHLRTAFAIAIVATLATCKSVVRELEPTPPPRSDMTQISRSIPSHEPVPGSEARTALLFTHALPGLAAHVEIREYYVSQGRELAIALTNEALFEVRSGRFDVEAPNDKGERSSGAMWSAVPGDRVVVRTISEMAILRATYVVKD